MFSSSYFFLRAYFNFFFVSWTTIFGSKRIKKYRAFFSIIAVFFTLKVSVSTWTRKVTEAKNWKQEHRASNFLCFIMDARNANNSLFLMNNQQHVCMYAPSEIRINDSPETWTLFPPPMQNYANSSLPFRALHCMHVLGKETLLERDDFTLQLLMFVTTEKERVMLILFFHFLSALVPAIFS